MLHNTEIEGWIKQWLAELSERQRRVIAHGGESVGFLSQNTVYTDQRAAIVVFTNADFSSATDTLTEGLEKIVLDGPEATVAEGDRISDVRALYASIVGGTLDRKHWGRQVICYGPGDYSGPHNDHHPESAAARNGFVDLHIMFSNDPYVHELYRMLIGDNVHWQDREAWIYSKNVYTRYPFQGALYGLPPQVLKECLTAERGAIDYATVAAGLGLAEGAARTGQREFAEPAASLLAAASRATGGAAGPEGSARPVSRPTRSAATRWPMMSRTIASILRALSSAAPPRIRMP